MHRLPRLRVTPRRVSTSPDHGIVQGLCVDMNILFRSHLQFIGHTRLGVPDVWAGFVRFWRSEVRSCSGWECGSAANGCSLLDGPRGGYAVSCHRLGVGSVGSPRGGARGAAAVRVEGFGVAPRTTRNLTEPFQS